MKFLLTGAGGFLGSAVAEELRNGGHEVEGVGATGRGGWPVADLRDPGVADRVIADASPEVVVHLAGQSSPEAAEEDPADAFRANAATTWNLLEAASQQAPGALFILGSSASVYGRPDPAIAGHIPEGAPMEPDSFYGASKAAAEMVTGGYAAESKPAVAILRTFNLIGPGQRQGVAAILTDAARKGELPLPVWNPESVRDFTDVRDAARAIAAVAEARTTGTFNLCSGSAVRIGELAELVARVADMDPSKAIPDEARTKGGGDVLVGDPARLGKATGWESRIPLEMSLEEMVAGIRD